MDRQAGGRQDRRLHRPPAPPPLRDRARAGRPRAHLHRRPRRPGHLPGQYLQPALAPAVFAAGADPARVLAGPCAADAAGGGDDRPAGLPPLFLHLRLRRRLGALQRIPRPGNGHLPHALRAVRLPELPGLARRAAGGGYRHPSPALDTRAGAGLPARKHGAGRSRDRDRGGPLHRLAGAGAVLLPGRDGDTPGPRARREGAGSEVRHPRLPRRGAVHRLGAVAGAEPAHRPIHRRRRQAMPAGAKSTLASSLSTPPPERASCHRRENSIASSASPT